MAILKPHVFCHVAATCSTMRRRQFVGSFLGASLTIALLHCFKHDNRWFFVLRYDNQDVGLFKYFEAKPTEVKEGEPGMEVLVQCQQTRINEDRFSYVDKCQARVTLDGCGLTLETGGKFIYAVIVVFSTH